MTVYLDNCCYNRPFDDRSNIRNYLEREAVLLIMQMAYIISIDEAILNRAKIIMENSSIKAFDCIHLASAE